MALVVNVRVLRGQSIAPERLRRSAYFRGLLWIVWVLVLALFVRTMANAVSKGDWTTVGVNVFGIVLFALITIPIARLEVERTRFRRE